MNIEKLIQFLDKKIEDTGQSHLTAREANGFLEKAGLLADSSERQGQPLRRILRKGLIKHAYQENTRWIIPHSSGQKFRKQTNLSKASNQIEATRESYKPKFNSNSTSGRISPSRQYILLPRQFCAL